MIWKFWWGYSNEERKIHWVTWKHLCEAKENGGMGFKEIEKFNDDLLAKQVWRMMHKPNSLCHKMFKVRFFLDCSILEAKESTIGSYAWKIILSARDVIKKGMVWQVGNGQFVCIREDKWLPDQIYRTVITPPSPSPPFLYPLMPRSVSSLILSQLCGKQIKLILSIPLNVRLPPNCLIWSQTPTGVFTTRSAYQLLANFAMANSASSSNPNP